MDAFINTNLTSLASENQSASRSRIMDADFAAETANLSRGRILQLVGMAMLAKDREFNRMRLSMGVVQIVVEG